MPRPSDGSARAHGIERAVRRDGSPGPKAPARGQRSAAASSTSSAPGRQLMSGLATSSHCAGPAPAAPRLAAAP